MKRAEEILARARTDELMIYAVQFRSTARGRLAEVPLSPRPGQVLSDDRFRNPPATEMLRRIAHQTGGGHFLLGEFDDINATFTRVMQELHYQYVLGFTPQRADGKLHALEVRVRRPGSVDPGAPELSGAAATGRSTRALIGAGLSPNIRGRPDKDGRAGRKIVCLFAMPIFPPPSPPSPAR